MRQKIRPVLILLLDPVLILDVTSLLETSGRSKKHIGTNPQIMAKATDGPHFML